MKILNKIAISTMIILSSITAVNAEYFIKSHFQAGMIKEASVAAEDLGTLPFYNKINTDVSRAKASIKNSSDFNNMLSGATNYSLYYTFTTFDIGENVMISGELFYSENDISEADVIAGIAVFEGFYPEGMMVSKASLSNNEKFVFTFDIAGIEIETDITKTDYNENSDIRYKIDL